MNLQDCAELAMVSYCFAKRMLRILVMLELNTVIYFRGCVIQFGAQFPFHSFCTYIH